MRLVRRLPSVQAVTRLTSGSMIKTAHLAKRWAQTDVARRLFGTFVLLLLFLVGSALAPPAVHASSHGGSEDEGIVAAINTDDGLIILENGRQYRHLQLDGVTHVVRAGGGQLSLHDLRPGDIIVYRFEVRHGLWIVTDIAVLPLSLMGQRRW
jgi:hypothetical protein